MSNEPSPKGLGFPAHIMPLYKIMIGKDNSYWYVAPTSNSRRWNKLKLPKIYFKDMKNITIKKIVRGSWYNDIIVYYNGPEYVYRDTKFEKAVRKITKTNASFSEQGLQRPNKAHLEIPNKDIIKIIKKYN